MASVLAQKQSRLKKLIALGREQGYLTYSEVNDHLPDDISDPEQIEDIIGMINDMGIMVYETAPEADDLMVEADVTDDLAADEAAAVLVAVENETGRTSDPVRMYMREMGTVELLTREGEIVIAKRIEEGIRELLSALALYPGAVKSILDEYELVTKEERKLADIMVGYLDPAQHVPTAAELAEAAQAKADKAGTDEEEETDNGPDPVEAKKRFTALKRQYNKTEKVIAEKGRTVAAAIKEMEKLLINLNDNFTPLMLNLNGTMKDTRVVVQEFSREIKPVLSSLEKTLNKATELLSESQYAVRSFEDLSSPEAPLWQALEALKEAAESTKNLTDTLERNPESIIYGKGDE